MSESKLQQSAVTWFRLQYPSKLITSFAAGFAFAGDAKRRAITGNRMKAMGYLVGTPDILIPHPNLIHHALFIEMKWNKNKPSAQQLQVIEQLRSNGYRVEICYSFDSFRSVVEDYFKH